MLKAELWNSQWPWTFRVPKAHLGCFGSRDAGGAGRDAPHHRVLVLSFGRLTSHGVLCSWRAVPRLVTPHTSFFSLKTIDSPFAYKLVMDYPISYPIIAYHLFSRHSTIPGFHGYSISRKTWDIVPRNGRVQATGADVWHCCSLSLCRIHCDFLGSNKLGHVFSQNTSQHSPTINQDSWWFMYNNDIQCKSWSMVDCRYLFPECRHVLTPRFIFCEAGSWQTVNFAGYPLMIPGQPKFINDHK